MCMCMYERQQQREVTLVSHTEKRETDTKTDGKSEIEKDRKIGQIK